MWWMKSSFFSISHQCRSRQTLCGKHFVGPQGPTGNKMKLKPDRNKNGKM